MAVPKPPAKLLKLASQALPKAAKQRTAAEKRAIRLTKAWRDSQKSGQGGGPGTPSTGPDLSFYTQPMSLEQMQAQAASLAQSQLQPSMQEIARLQEQAIRDAAAQQQLISGLTTSLGGMVAPIGGQIQQSYMDAANLQSQLAQGFTGSLNEAAEAEAAANAQFLQQQGAPAAQIQGVQDASGGAGNVLYGTGGFIPSTALGREGAAFAAAGHQLPGVVARMGQQDAARVAAEGGQIRSDLARQAADLQAQLPGMTQAALMDLVDRETAKFQANREFQFAKQEANRQFQLQKQAAKAAAQAAGVDMKKWEREMRLAEAQFQAELDSVSFDQWATSQGIAQDWAALEGAGQQDKQERADRKAKGVKAREAEIKSLRSAMKRAAEGMMTEGFFGTKKKPTYKQAEKRLREAFAAEIDQMRKRFGLKPARINQLIKSVLAELGITPPNMAFIAATQPTYYPPR